MKSNIIKFTFIILLVIGTFVLKCQGNNHDDRNALKIKKKEVKPYSMRGQSGVHHFPRLSSYKFKRSIPRIHRGRYNHVNSVALDSPLLSRQYLRKKKAYGVLKLPKIQNEKRLSKIRSIHQSHLVSSRGIKSGKNPHKTKHKHNIRYDQTHHLGKRSQIGLSQHVKRKRENGKELTHKGNKCSKKISIKKKEKLKEKRHKLHHR